MNTAIVLMYHNIAMPPKTGRLRSLYVTPRMFRFQMWYLRAAGFKVVPLGEILSSMKGHDQGSRRVALTFDDGYRDFYQNAYPVLEKYGYPSTVFLVSDLIGQENLWDNDRLKICKRLLNWDEIAEMKSRNVSFGSHTKTHPFLSGLSSHVLKEELFASKAELEKRLGLPIEFFCYPYGDYDERTLSVVREAGYLGAVTISRGLVHRGDDPFQIRRSFIRLRTHPLLFMLKLHTRYEDRKGKRA
jgi:peptidoglycan/xylan/chitin deacetylase (PgdA/CDA1 family)